MIPSKTGSLKHRAGLRCIFVNLVSALAVANDLEINSLNRRAKNYFNITIGIEVRISLEIELEANRGELLDWMEKRIS